MYGSLKKVKLKLDAILNPTMLSLYRKGVRPVHITLLSLVFGVAGALLFASDRLLSILLLLMWFLLDVLDGMLARASHTVSSFGVWIDFLVDRIVVVLLLWKYYEATPDSRLTVGLALGLILVLTLGEIFRKN
jgi:phosphatidylglycerophosphate synthase